MGGILSFYAEQEDNNLTVETMEANKVNKCMQTDDEECIEKCKDLKLKVEYLENFCKNLENRILNIEKARRTILL